MFTLIGATVIVPGTSPIAISFTSTCGAWPTRLSAVVLGPEIVAERRHFFTAILKIRSDGPDRPENEDEGAHGQQDNRKVGHSVLLCMECPRQLERHGPAGGLHFKREAG